MQERDNVKTIVINVLGTIVPSTFFLNISIWKKMDIIALLRTLFTNNKMAYYSMRFFVLAFLASCGGSGDGSSNVSNGDDTGPILTDSVNGGLEGKLFFGAPKEGWLLDFNTGNFTRIPGVDWSQEDDSVYIPLAIYSAISASDGSEFLTLVENCAYSESIDLVDNDCLVIHKANGEIVGSVEVLEGIREGARLSHDRQHIAFVYNTSYLSRTNQDILIIIDRNFGEVSSAILPNTTGWGSLDWLPNGQIVYTHDNTIYITSPYNAEGSPLYEFSESEGRPDHVSVSPDGEKIAFTLITDILANAYGDGHIKGTVWVIDQDATNLHRLAYMQDVNDQSIIFPCWSPDGKYILALVDEIPDFVVGFYYRPALYAIPSNSENLYLDKEGKNNDDKVVRVKSYYLRDIVGLGDDIVRASGSDGLAHGFSETNFSYSWLP